MKPFVLVMRAMGVLPVSPTAEAKVVFSWMSLAMLYSVCLYLLLCFAVWFTNENRMQAIRRANGRFEESVDAYMLFVCLVPLAYLPFTHWREAGKIARYFNDWSIFQARFRQVTGNNLVLPFKCQCFTVVVLTLGLSHISILASYDVRNFSIENIPDALLYVYLTALRNLAGLYWCFTFAALSYSAVLLEQSLSKALDRSPMRSAVLAEYRLLWLELSHLATQTGAANCYTCGCYLLHHFFMVALSAYATLSDAISGNYYSDTWAEIFTIFSAFTVVAICEGANTVFLKAKVAFQKKLLRLETTADSKTVQLQVNTFLQTIAAEPPVITLGGYVRINRQLLVGFGSTMVTYLIVLLQLKFSVTSTLK